MGEYSVVIIPHKLVATKTTKIILPQVVGRYFTRKDDRVFIQCLQLFAVVVEDNESRRPLDAQSFSEARIATCQVPIKPQWQERSKCSEGIVGKITNIIPSEGLASPSRVVARGTRRLLRVNGVTMARTACAIHAFDSIDSSVAHEVIVEESGWLWSQDRLAQCKRSGNTRRKTLKKGEKGGDRRTG